MRSVGFVLKTISKLVLKLLERKAFLKIMLLFLKLVAILKICYHNGKFFPNLSNATWDSELGVYNFNIIPHSLEFAIYMFMQ